MQSHFSYYPDIPPAPELEALEVVGSDKTLGFVTYTPGRGWKFYSKIEEVTSRYLTSYKYDETATEAIPSALHEKISEVRPAAHLHRNDAGFFVYY